MTSRLPLLLAFVLAACAREQPPASAPAVTPAPASAPAAEAAADPLLEDVRILSADDMQGRQVGSPGNARARAYILRRFAQIGLQPLFDTGFEIPFIARGRQGPLDGVNLIARIKGSASSARVLVVTAHYDHVGVRRGEIYNGADDNASGVAALLAIAASLGREPPLHDVILGVVDAEEAGIQGSRAMLAEPRFAALLPSVALEVNFDMLGRSDRDELYVAGAHHFAWLKPRLDALAAQAPVKLLQGHDSPSWGKSQDWTGESDHVAFHERQTPWVYFGVEDHPDYHRPTDDFERIPRDFFRRSAATVELAVRAFDRDLDAIATEAGR